VPPAGFPAQLTSGFADRDPVSRPSGRVVPLRASAAPSYGGNVVLFDPVKARRNRIRPL